LDTLGTENLLENPAYAEPLAVEKLPSMAFSTLAPSVGRRSVSRWLHLCMAEVIPSDRINKSQRHNKTCPRPPRLRG